MRIPWTKEVVEEVAVAVEAPVVKTPAAIPEIFTPRKPELTVEEADEYMQLVSELGIETNGAVIQESLRRFFDEENIHAYDTKQVVNYLDEKLGKEWLWAGLRQCDVDHLGGWVMHSSRDVLYGRGIYHGAVPLPVLVTVKKVLAAVPQAHFYVSAPKNNVGDPFLLVSGQGIGYYVIERWDEPNFRER